MQHEHRGGLWGLETGSPTDILLVGPERVNGLPPSAAYERLCLTALRRT
jgi:hypothetical protein